MIFYITTLDTHLLDLSGRGSLVPNLHFIENCMESYFTSRCAGKKAWMRKCPGESGRSTSSCNVGPATPWLTSVPDKYNLYIACTGMSQLSGT